MGGLTRASKGKSFIGQSLDINVIDKKMETNTDLWDKAKLTALKVEFLTNYEGLFLYASAIYFATIWGKEVDEKNRAIWKMNKSGK